MGIVQNVYEVAQGEVRWLIYLILIGVAVKLFVSKKFTAVGGMLFMLIIAIGFLQYPEQVVGFFSNLFERILPSSATVVAFFAPIRNSAVVMFFLPTQSVVSILFR